MASGGETSNCISRNHHNLILFLVLDIFWFSIFGRSHSLVTSFRQPPVIMIQFARTPVHPVSDKPIAGPLKVIVVWLFHFAASSFLLMRARMVCAESRHPFPYSVSGIFLFWSIRHFISSANSVRTARRFCFSDSSQAASATSTIFNVFIL